MIVNPIKTRIIKPNDCQVIDLLKEYIPSLMEGSIVVVTSKVVSLCEGRVVPLEGNNKEDLIAQEADYFLPASMSKYGCHFSVIRNTLISSAGIDESNGDGNFVLWPADPQQSANDIRHFLVDHFKVRDVGVIIVDSASRTFRMGASGVAIGISGFKAMSSYIGKPDLFGRPFVAERSDIAGGLASAAVVAMGEGNEGMPLAIIEDVPFVEFQQADPTPEDLAVFSPAAPEDDLYEVFYRQVTWQRGKHRRS